MGRLMLAFQLFFRVLRSGDFAAEARRLLEPAAPPTPLPPAPALEPTSSRSDALNLLAVLQREGRLVDFLKEDIAAYADAQVGAAVRDVHRDCAAALERIFALRPLRSEAEDSMLQVPGGFDAHALRLTGNLAGQPPYHGRLRHAGWVATRQNLPAWTGAPDSALIVAPAEVEV
jgi:hypothetical protein